jgi:hypothetical protein
MTNLGIRRGRAGVWLLFLVLVPLGTAGALTAYLRYHRDSGVPPTSSPEIGAPPSGAVAQQIKYFCSACHNYPPPDTFPRSAWGLEVERGYKFFSEAGMNLVAPPLDATRRYYEDQAPEELPLAQYENVSTPVPVEFEQIKIEALPGDHSPAISNVNLVKLTDERRLDLLACDMRRGQVLLLKPYEANPTWKVIANVPNPAHTEVVDLDGDGIKDILVANLGNFKPTDRACGSVVWLRGNRDGSFTPHILLQDIGRVADVQWGEFRKGSGKKDLIVACFGWNHVGEIYFLENQTTDWSKPKFAPRMLDKRHGTIHVPPIDLDGDGNLDFVALISQEHEAVVAFLGNGKGGFKPKELFRGPHPAYGSSGIQLVDLNGDGKMDILYTNGDTLDMPFILKPYHGVQWLENKGNLKFEHHPLTPMYGVHRAIGADFAGKELKDIVAVNFLPSDAFKQRKEKKLDSVIYLEQIAPGQFVRHSLEQITCDHTTCAAGDIFGTGRIDFVTGSFVADGESNLGVTIWKNLGPRKGTH